MPTFKITLAYDGTDFVGWQRQANGTSVQGLIEDALGDLDGREVTVTGAGRTDAGVHALGQVAGFSLDRAIGAAAVARALNARLPPEIRVVSAAEAGAAFHARFDARAKTYRYRIWNADVVSPFERRYAWHVGGALDAGTMDAAARMLEGHHDFAAFRAAGGTTQTTERTVTMSRITSSKGDTTESTEADGGHGNSDPVTSVELDPFRDLRGSALERALIVYEITGDGFLRYMVRAIVGTLVEIGRGRQQPAWMADVLAGRDRARAGPTAPPQGLFLVRVDYGP